LENNTTILKHCLACVGCLCDAEVTTSSMFFDLHQNLCNFRRVLCRRRRIFNCGGSRAVESHWEATQA